MNKAVWPTVFFFQVLATTGQRVRTVPSNQIDKFWNSALLLAHMIDTATTRSYKKHSSHQTSICLIVNYEGNGT